MSIEAYKIAVNMSLTNHVSAGLAAMVKDFAKTEEQAALLQKRLNGIKSDFMKGGLMLGAGVGMLSLLKHPLDDALEWEKTMARLKQKGLGDGQIADAKKFITANDIIGMSMLERAKIFDEAQGSFRQSGMGGAEAMGAAKAMMQPLAAYKVAMESLDSGKQKGANGAFLQLNKIVEIMGGLNDPERAKQIVGSVFKAVQGSGKMVDERQLRLFNTFGGSAVSTMTDKNIFAHLEPLIGEFGGSTVATGLNTAYRRMGGMTAMLPRASMQELTKLGIWDKNQLELNSQGGIKKIKDRDKLVDKDLFGSMTTDTVAFTEKLMAVYKAHGIVTQKQMETENQILFSTTGARIYNKAMAQLAVMKESGNAFGVSQTPDQVNNNNPMQKILDMKAKYEDMQLQLGLVAFPLLIKALNIIVPALTDVARWMRENTGAVKGLVYAFVALASGLAFRGVVLLLSSAFEGLGLAMLMKNIGGAAGITKLGGAMNWLGGSLQALAIGWTVGTILNDTLIAGTKFGDWIGKMCARFLAFFGNSEAKAALKANGGEMDWTFGSGRGMVGDKPGGYYDNIRTASQNKANQTVAAVNLDGQKVGNIVFSHGYKQASNPFGGISGFDMGQSLISPGMAAR